MKKTTMSHEWTYHDRPYGPCQHCGVSLDAVPLMHRAGCYLLPQEGEDAMKPKRKPKQGELFPVDPVFEHDIRKREQAELRDPSPRPNGASMRPLPKRRRDGPHR